MTTVVRTLGGGEKVLTERGSESDQQVRAHTHATQGVRSVHNQ